MSDDDNKNKPLVFGSQNSLSHNYICEPRNEVSLLLLGGKSSHGVEFTQDQVSNLARWLEIDPKDVVDRSTDSSIESFTKAGNWRNISRYAHIHGLRLMGFLAGRGLLEKEKTLLKVWQKCCMTTLKNRLHLKQAMKTRKNNVVSPHRRAG